MAQDNHQLSFGNIFSPLLERLNQAILEIINTPENIQELTVSERCHDKRSKDSEINADIKTDKVF